VALPYTQRFILAPPGVDWVSYDVPAGYRVIVRSITIHNSGNSGDGAGFWLAGAPIIASSPDPGETTALELHAAAYAGEQLVMSAFGQNVTSQVTGYIFVDETGPIGRQRSIELAEPAPLPADG
jgi:hypothetical protein